jgi:hypothetical protein
MPARWRIGRHSRGIGSACQGGGKRRGDPSDMAVAYSPPSPASSGGWASYGPYGFRLGGRLGRRHSLLRQHLGCQFLRRRIDRLGRLAIERDALVMGKHGPAVERCHLPRPEHAERVLDRPVHCCGDLVGDTQRQWANILSWDRECERPLLPKSVELLAVFLGAAVAFGVMPPFRHPRLLPVSDPCAMLTK